MARIRARWVVIAVAVAMVLFAIVVGGFLWPRPQFERGRTPWTLEDTAPSRADSLPSAAPGNTPRP
jgi:hypothetical protein